MEMDDRYLLQSVFNSLKILDLLSVEDELGVTEISKKLNLGKATVFRILYTLEKKEYITKTEQSKYKLGIKFVNYGSIVLDRIDIISIVKPFLEKLRDKHNETTHMAVLNDDYNIIFMAKELSTSTIQMNSRIGGMMPAYCTAMGKALLAQLSDEELHQAIKTFDFKKSTAAGIKTSEELYKEIERIRLNGYSENLEESEAGLTCFAASIKEVKGKYLSAISISGPTGRMLKNKAFLIKSVIKTASEISKVLGG